MHASNLVVTFRTPTKRPAAPAGDIFCDEVERFAAADPRWRDALAMAAARLNPRALCTLGVALSGLEAGPLPGLLSFDFGPDDMYDMEREDKHLAPVIREALGLLTPERLSLTSAETAAVRGIITAVHRLLRIAKTRP
ncbi:MAG: hypothetical protein AAB554_02775 [Patescibacteria group bacterium]